MNYHNGLTLTDEELTLIEEVRETVEIKNRNRKVGEKEAKLWDQEELTNLKRRIKGHFRSRLNERCCYCRKNIREDHNLTIDIEHILPKHRFGDYEFTPFNLSISCKRCNMIQKGQKVDFLNDLQIAQDNPQDVGNYKFLHPNFDNYFGHISRTVVEVNEKILIKYMVQEASAKGQYTYEYFDLKGIEINTINEAQGITVIDTDALDDLAQPIKEQLENVLKSE